MKPTIRILVIEDERNILSFITSVLESQNYQVISASNATEGLSQAASSTPDLILLDLGLDVYKRQRMSFFSRCSSDNQCFHHCSFSFFIEEFPVISSCR